MDWGLPVLSGAPPIGSSYPELSCLVSHSQSGPGFCLCQLVGATSLQIDRLSSKWVSAEEIGVPESSL